MNRNEGNWIFQHVIYLSASSEGSLKRVLTTSTTRRALIVGCGLQAFQQLSGINTVM